jgi:hypothetical protein
VQVRLKRRHHARARVVRLKDALEDGARARGVLRPDLHDAVAGQSGGDPHEVVARRLGARVDREVREVERDRHVAVDRAGEPRELDVVVGDAGRDVRVLLVLAEEVDGDGEALAGQAPGGVQRVVASGARDVARCGRVGALVALRKRADDPLEALARGEREEQAAARNSRGGAP